MKVYKNLNNTLKLILSVFQLLILILGINNYFIQKNINIDLLLTVLFSSAIKENINAIFITTNGLNDAKCILINGKLFQGIGTIHISEIENWDKIKNKSHWTNVILTDASISIAGKHFAFAFETRDLHNLLNFEYSLLNDKGELLEFVDGEDKIRALNFSIQIVN